MVLQAQPVSKETTVTWEALTDALGAAGRIQPQILVGSNLGVVAG